jgi:hypothetical protein
LPTPGGPQEEDILAVGHEEDGGQFLQLPLVDGGLKGEVELIQRLGEREMTLPRLYDHLMGIARRHLGI